MSVPLQVGGPVSVELLIILGLAVVLSLVTLGISVWIYYDARRRNQPHAFAWAAGSFLSVFLGGVGGFVVLGLYFVVRDETGAGAPSVREEA
jgi:cytochrome c biogenesis factor